MKKRVLSLILTCAMLLGMMSGVALAGTEPVAVQIKMNAVSTAMTLKDSADQTVEVGTPADGAYQLQLTPGEYTITGLDASGTANGTLGLTVTEAASQTYQLWTVTNVYATNSGWVLGTDYTAALRVSSADGTARRAELGRTGGAEGHAAFLCYEADSASVTFAPAAARTGYMDRTVSGTQNGNKSSGFSAEIPAGNTCTFTVPSADCTLRVGVFSQYYIYSDYTAKSRTVNTDGTVTYTYQVPASTNIYYRVSKPGSVAYWNWAKPAAATDYTVAADDLAPTVGGQAMADGTVIRDLSANLYDVASVLMTVNPAGYVNLAAAGDTYRFECFRNWQAINSFMNNEIAEPDYHCRAIAPDGSASDVVSVAADGANSAILTVTARKPGVAIILVTYGAMNDHGAQGGQTLSALWPENTGVFVVTVGADGTAVKTNMTLNAGKNTTDNKLAGDAIDSELDVLYYEQGTAGATYSFTPESGAAVSVLRPVLTENSLTYAGWSTEGVSAADGVCTLTGLTAGKNIVRVTKGGVSAYQVLTVKAFSYKVYSDAACTQELTDTSALTTGSTFYLRFSTVYMPANKMAGIYNMGAHITLTDAAGGVASSIRTAMFGQYDFAYDSKAQTVKVTIPKYYTGNRYVLSGGILESGFGSPYGAHRGTSYETGKNPQFNASVRTALLGALPEISLPITAASFVGTQLNITDAAGKAVPGCTVKVTDADGNALSPDASYALSTLPGVTYQYQIFKAGFRYQTGSFKVPATQTETYPVAVSLTAAADGAWDGVTRTAPQQANGAWQIGTGAELAWFAAEVNAGREQDSDAVLTADIDLAGYPWTPAGSATKTYSGVFDGRKHTVSGLFISTKDSFAGLFGAAKSPIRNLTVAGEITTANGAAGGIVGYLQAGTAAQPAALENCVSRVTVTYGGTSGTSIGGLAGYTGSSDTAPTTLKNCTFAGSIRAPGASEVGGIVGSTTGSATLVSGCVNSGSVAAAADVGGICGLLGSGSQLYGCENTGAVASTSADSSHGTGGLVGTAAATAATGIANSINRGPVTASGTGAYAGGIVGAARTNKAESGILTIRNVYNSGSVTAENGGGIAGYAIAQSAAGPVALDGCWNEGAAAKGTVGGGTLTSGTATAAAEYVSVSDTHYLSTAATADGTPASVSYTREAQSLAAVAAALNQTVARGNSSLYKTWKAESDRIVFGSAYVPRTLTLRTAVSGESVTATASDIASLSKTYEWYRWTTVPCAAGTAASAAASGSEYGWTENNGVWTSGNAGKSSSTATLTVTYTLKAGEHIGFKWKASTEEGYDFLTYQLDGAEKGKISGKTDWAEVTLGDLSAGRHTLTFRYAKDSGANYNDDAGSVELLSQGLGWAGTEGTGDTLTAPADAARVYCVVQYSDGVRVASAPLPLGTISVTAAAYDYTAAAAKLTGASSTGVIAEQTVEVPAGAAAADVIAKAFAAAKVEIKGVQSGYVTQIGALASGTGGGYSGWCFGYYDGAAKTFDDFGNMGFASLGLLHDGDRLEFHYTVNPDAATDDIGNGWYGLPVFSSFKLADGQRVTLSKTTAYDASYQATTSYFIAQGNQKAPMQGSGTENDPFVIHTVLTAGADASRQTAAFTTALDSHYYTVRDEWGDPLDLSQPQDYSNGLTVCVSTKGGRHTAWYQITAAAASAADTESTISVTFRLIGATKASKPVDYSAKVCDAGYVTWIGTETVRLKQGATVGELFRTAADAAGLTYVGLENNYISSITAPALLGGYALAEFTNGSNSGWMYTVNGSHPAYGLNDCTLHNGDAVVWHYVNDYAYEVEDWVGGSKGSAAVWNLWLKAPDGSPAADAALRTVRFEANGGSAVAAQSVKSGAKAAAPAAPVRAGYTFQGWFTDSVCTKAYDFSVPVTADLTLYAGWKTAAAADRFTDLKGHWAAADIAETVARGLFAGTTDTTFSPDATMTRAMLVTALWRLDGSPAAGTGTFADVKAGQYYAAAVAWAEANGIITGYNSKTFGPNEPVTREQAAAMLYRYAQYRKYDTTQGGMALREFSDSGDVSAYAEAAMTWAVNTQILRGSNGRLLPRSSATRAEVAVILARFCRSFVK